MQSQSSFTEVDKWYLDTSIAFRVSTWILIAMLFIRIAAHVGVAYSLESVSDTLAPLAEWTKLIFVSSAVLSAAFFTASLIKKAVKLQFVGEFAIAVLLAVLLPTV